MDNTKKQCCFWQTVRPIFGRFIGLFSTPIIFVIILALYPIGKVLYFVITGKWCTLQQFEKWSQKFARDFKRINN